MNIFTKEEVNDAFGKIINAECLIDILDRAETNLNSGEVTAVCDILNSLLHPAVSILDHLNLGNEKFFSELWKDDNSAVSVEEPEQTE
jgi:hypothetical protein